MKILMVCLGNICRSPMAEGILRKKIQEKKLNIVVDSAGTSDFHIGESPDKRAVATLKQFGIDISTLTGRQFTHSDFALFDKIYAMDVSNYNNILALSKNGDEKRKVDLLLNSVELPKNKNVPDPWFGGDEGFTEVYYLLDQVCNKLIEKLETQLS